MTPLFIVLGAAVVLVLICVGLYNGLVTARVRVQDALSEIDVQFKRRFDLIPNLISTVKGSANFETTTLEKIVAARAQSQPSQSTVAQMGESDKQVRGAIGGIFALAENYPDLKSNANFLSLQSELADTENKIQSARRLYNNTVKELNTKIQTVPTNFFAKMFSFTEAEFFQLDEADAEAKNPVKVSF